MKPFRRRKGRAYASFEPYEAQMVVTFARQVVELLRDDSPERQRGADPLEELFDFDGPVETPDDPVVARLLPDGYRDDEEGAADFRRFTERGLREQKVRNAQLVIDSLTHGDPVVEGETDEDGRTGEDDQIEVELDETTSQAWLRALTDIRLALGTRLGVTDDDEDRWEALPDDDPEAMVHDVYDWLGFVQESLVRVLD